MELHGCHWSASHHQSATHQRLLNRLLQLALGDGQLTVRAMQLLQAESTQHSCRHEIANLAPRVELAVRGGELGLDGQLLLALERDDLLRLLQLLLERDVLALDLVAFAIRRAKLGLSLQASTTDCSKTCEQWGTHV